MLNIRRPVPFVLISTNHGTFIINRNDYHMLDEKRAYGVGYDLLSYSSYETQEINFALALIDRRRQSRGPGVVAIDCGANIGIHTVEWARLMHGWGRVISFEAQEKIFYALAGNIALNNCLNVTARHCAVGATCGTIDVPEIDYLVPTSFGSLELRQGDNNQFIGQAVDYRKTTPVPMVSIDSFELDRVDFIKIDVEGMEEDVLEGARGAIRKSRPIMMIEVLKSDRGRLEAFLQQEGYKIYPTGKDILAVHAEDPVGKGLSFENNVLRLV